MCDVCPQEDSAVTVDYVAADSLNTAQTESKPLAARCVPTLPRTSGTQAT